LITTEDRFIAIVLIKEASLGGARRHMSCELLGITVRTLERWEKEKGQQDRRKLALRPQPANQLTAEQRKMVLTIADSAEYRNLPPSKIVPMLSDTGRYIASESTFYRLMRAAGLLTHRQATKRAKNARPEAYEAHKSNQVWSWDISVPQQAA
jgi:putative transposase